MATGFREAIFMRCLWSFIFLDRDASCTKVKGGIKGMPHLASNPMKEL